MLHTRGMAESPFVEIDRLAKHQPQFIGASASFSKT
jgi:hypothetical protein